MLQLSQWKLVKILCGPLNKVCHTCKKLEGEDDLSTEKLRPDHALKCKMNYNG